jgi:glycosyltransferase involved in cell wall biosynthesis
MDNPAAAAQRLLLGSGLGLLLVSGLSLQRGMLSADQLSLGWLIPLAATTCIGIGLTMGEGKAGLLSGLFPDEDQDELVERVQEQAELEEKEANIGGAWAQLEVDLLSTEVGEEE